MSAALAAFAVHLVLLNNFLRFEGYPLLRLEVLYSVVVAAVVAAIFGMAYWAADKLPNWPCRIARAILVASLLGWAVALITNMPFPLIAALAAGACSLLFGTQVLLPLALGATVAFLAASAGIGQQVQAPFETRGASIAPSIGSPAVVHIILDEQIGVEGLPDRNPGTPRLRSIIERFYVSHGFRLFGGAYSRNYKTFRSIPFILNFGSPTSLNRSYPSKNSAYFSLMKNAGYRLDVLQSEYLDYCSQIVDRCSTYESQSFSPIATSPLSALDKAVLIERKMVPKEIFAKILHVCLLLQRQGIPVSVPSAIEDISPTPLNGLAAMHRLQADLTSLRPGTFYFAHILLPHSPFALRPDCSVSPVSNWQQGSPGRPQRAREDAYAQQALCALNQVSRVIDAVQRSPAGQNTVIIVHGDHGSRINDVEPFAENIGKFGDETLLAGYSTLFAVRGPNLTPGYDSQHYPVTQLLQELAASKFEKTASHPDPHPAVILLDRKLSPRRVEALPRHW